ncbi:hypothetical protein [Mesorhizobium sp. M3A.F.Ca.ET.201.01.1.1]|uniref:hypothetical protein n=1 Tax=Mesorhizobium sp. M3A.F.Ca.ET.201.01.1.1 TaxID=2563946 RepID=UPI001677ED36|nr:hypothetical protein [Mesorhizobium sp. M3A.F.Ca.ET.201.01.1.1]
MTVASWLMLPERSDWKPRLGVPSVTMPVSRFEPGCSEWTSLEVTTARPRFPDDRRCR